MQSQVKSDLPESGNSNSGPNLDREASARGQGGLSSDSHRQSSEAVERRLAGVGASGLRISPDSQSLLISLGLHVLIVLALALLPVINHQIRSVHVTKVTEAEPVEEFRLVDQVVAADEPADYTGANSDARDTAAALSAAQVIANISEVPSPDEVESLTKVNYSVTPNIPVAIGLIRSPLAVKGTTGVGENGLDGAVDRLTYEILRSMEDSPTLVVWLFDQSGSLSRQREEIRNRFDRIYEELGIVAKSYESREINDHRLLTAIICFGQAAHLITPKPVAEVDEIRQAIDSIQEDPSGIENVFTALQLGINKFKSYRTGRSGRGEARNILFVVVTDERGDDPHLLDTTIRDCRKFAIPVYVLGVPAPFGRDIAYLKYVDPDPGYDQSPQWAEVDQGPESLLPERVRLGYRDEQRFSEPMIDSGFGPYALSRLTYETGGMFFTIHPNRRLGGRVARGEIAPFASDLRYFFDPEVMEKYRPDYLSEAEYLREVKSSPLRSALIQAAQMSSASILDSPETRFVKRDDAFLARSLTEAQQLPARILPDLEKIAGMLRVAEASRDLEVSPRWLAAYELSLGCVLANQVRTATYNEMLAKLKRGMDFENPQNNTWVLVPSPDISVGSRLEKDGQLARDLLQHVVVKHRGTPWGLLATRELEQPIGWKWTETATELNPQREAPTPNVVPPPADDQIRMLPPPVPKRPLPKL